MSILWRKAIQFRTISKQIAAVALGLILAAPAFAQANSPWENAVNVLQTAFTSPIARGLSLVAIVVSGLTFAFVRRQPCREADVLPTGAMLRPPGECRLQIR